MRRCVTPVRSVATTMARPMAKPPEPPMPSSSTLRCFRAPPPSIPPSVLLPEPVPNQGPDRGDRPLGPATLGLHFYERALRAAEQQNPHDALAVGHLIPLAQGHVARELGRKLHQPTRGTSMQP